MGRSMAQNLLKNGFGLVVVGGRAADAVKVLKAQGASVVDSPKQVAESSDVVMTCLPDSRDVEEVYLGARGILDGVRPGMILIDTSTISPEVAIRVAIEADKRGARMLDAPVTGGQQGAIDGTLTIMVGGDERTLEEC